MAMLSCVWYVTFKNSWETSMLGCLASALREFGVEAVIYTEGGTEGFEALDVLSWNSLRPFEKILIASGKGKLWHLWEREGASIPCWWRLVRARVRTMHTKLDNSGKWLGHPSLMFRAQAKSGESIIPPAFEVMVDSSAIQSWLPSSDEITLNNGGASDAILGAYASLQGIKVVAEPSEILDEALGREGYNNHSGAARRHIQEKFKPEESAKKLARLYKKMLGVKE